MDDLFKQIAGLDQEMMAELKKEVESLGGELEEFSMSDHVISIKVDDEHQEYLEVLVAEIIEKYEKKRKQLIDQDAFCGVRYILEELKEDE